MSPNQVTLIALLPYLAGGALILAATGNISLLIAQVAHYIRTGEERVSGRRVLVAALVANALLYCGLLSITYWPPREWLSAPIHDGWDLAVTWGLGVYLAGAVALAVASGAVMFALVAWSLPKAANSFGAWLKARRGSGERGPHLASLAHAGGNR